MFTKYEFKLKMFVAICCSYVKWCVSIVRSSVPLGEHSIVKVWILALLYKLAPCFVKIFFRLKKLICMLQLTVIVL